MLIQSERARAKAATSAKARRADLLVQVPLEFTARDLATVVRDTATASAIIQKAVKHGEITPIEGTRPQQYRRPPCDGPTNS